jgi:hypothetical protein
MCANGPFLGRPKSISLKVDGGHGVNGVHDDQLVDRIFDASSYITWFHLYDLRGENKRENRPYSGVKIQALPPRSYAANKRRITISRLSSIA